MLAERAGSSAAHSLSSTSSDLVIALMVSETCFTSAATTAKPLPASPARVASISALSARMRVVPVTALISDNLRARTSERLSVSSTKRLLSDKAKLLPRGRYVEEVYGERGLSTTGL